MQRRPDGSEGRTWTRTLFPSPTAPAQARWFLWSTAGRGDPPGDMEAAVLLLSEAVSNAVRHGQPGRAITVSLTRSGPHLRVGVRNRGSFRPPARHHDTGGWGLVLIQGLASRWGIEVDDTSVETWFEL